MEDLESLIEEYKTILKEYEDRKAHFEEDEKRINDMYKTVVERANKIGEAKEILESEGIPQEVHYFIPDGDTPFYKALSILSFETNLIIDRARFLYEKIEPEIFVEKPKFETFMKHFKRYLEVNGLELPKDKDVLYLLDTISSTSSAERYFELISDLIKLHVEEEKKYGIDIELVWRFISESANQPDYESELKELERKIRSHPDLIRKLTAYDTSRKEFIETVYRVAKKIGEKIASDYNKSEPAIIVNNLTSDHDFRRYDEVSQRLQQYDSPYFNKPIFPDTASKVKFIAMAAHLISCGFDEEEIKEIFIKDFGEHWWGAFSEAYNYVKKHEVRLTEKGLNILVGS